MERAEIFVKGDWMSTDAGMEGWNLKTVWPGAALPTTILNDWSVVPELSDVEATRYDFVVGGRYRTPGGFGLQLFFLGYPMHFDWTWLTDFAKSSPARFDFWIGYDF